MAIDGTSVIRVEDIPHKDIKAFDCGCVGSGPEMRHNVTKYSADYAVLEMCVRADYDTTAVHEPEGAEQQRIVSDLWLTTSSPQTKDGLMTRHGRLSHHRNHAQAVGALTGVLLLVGTSAVASANALQNPTHLSPAELAQKVAAATDASSDRRAPAGHRDRCHRDLLRLPQAGRRRRHRLKALLGRRQRHVVCSRQQALLQHHQGAVRGTDQHRRVPAATGSIGRPWRGELPVGRPTRASVDDRSDQSAWRRARDRLVQRP